MVGAFQNRFSQTSARFGGCVISVPFFLIGVAGPAHPAGMPH